KLLCPEQTVLAETDPTKARRIGRAWLGRYLEMVNYRENLLRLGFAASDLAGGGSDRLADAVIRWGRAAPIRPRVAEPSPPGGGRRTRVHPGAQARRGDAGAARRAAARCPRAGWPRQPLTEDERKPRGHQENAP